MSYQSAKFSHAYVKMSGNRLLLNFLEMLVLSVKLIFYRMTYSVSETSDWWTNMQKNKKARKWNLFFHGLCIPETQWILPPLTTLSNIKVLFCFKMVSSNITSFSFVT